MSHHVPKSSSKELEDLLNNFKQSFEEEKPELVNLKEKLENEAYQMHNIKEKGWGTSLLEKVPGLFGGDNKELFSNKFGELRRLISNYLDSYDRELKYFDKALVIKEVKSGELKGKIEEAKSTVTPTATKEKEEEENPVIRSLRELAEGGINIPTE